MFFWGGTWIAGRVIAQEVSAPLGIAALRFVVTALVLAGAVLFSGQALPRLQTSREWGVVCGLGFFGIFLYGLCFFYGLQHISAGRGALVVALNPVVIVIAAWLFGQERMNRRKALGSAIALAGCLRLQSGTPAKPAGAFAVQPRWPLMDMSACGTK